MAITSLSAQYISASFQNLVQVSSSGQLFDGAGNQITNLTASFAVTASYALNAGTGTSIDTGSFATTGSNVFNGSQTVNGDLIVTGSITAYQYVVSSSVINETIVFSSGSTIFGNDANDTHTFEGSIIMSGSANISSASYIDLLPLSNSLAPAYSEGRFYYNSEYGALTVYNDEADISLQVGQEFYIRVKNNSLTQIDDGTPCYIVGANGTNILVDAVTAPIHTGSFNFENHIIGVATHDIAGNGFGYLTTQGLVRGVDTDGWTVGDKLYLQTGSAGTAKSYLRNTPPPFPYDIVEIGYVTRVNVSQGEFYVLPKEPTHFGNISGLSGSYTSEVGDLWVYQPNNAWTHTRDLTGSYSVKGTWNVTGSLTVTGSSTFKVIGPSEFTGSVAINGTLSAPAATITAQSVTASLFGTASYAVNSLTASYALSGGSGGTSATVATAQTGSVTGTTSETLIQTLTIPANTLTTNDFARFSTKIFATNSNNYTVALYINSANTLNGSEKNITTLPVNSVIKFVVPTRTIAVNNVTTDTNWISENSQVQDPFQGTSALAHASSSIDWTTTQYALVSVTPQNAGDSFICRGTYFEKI